MSRKRLKASDVLVMPTAGNTPGFAGQGLAFQALAQEPIDLPSWLRGAEFEYGAHRRLHKGTGKGPCQRVRCSPTGAVRRDETLDSQGG